MKGNLIKEFVPLVATVGNEYPEGIETDRDGFWICHGDPTINILIYNITKKGTLRRSFTAPSRTTYGITTNGSGVTLSKSNTTIDVIDKKNNLIKNAAASAAIYRRLSFNGADYLAARAASAQIDFIDTKTYLLKRSMATGAVCNGVCAIGNKIATNEGNKLKYYDRKGNLIKSIALPTSGGAISYEDLCYDENYLWILSYSIKDAEPV